MDGTTSTYLRVFQLVKELLNRSHAEWVECDEMKRILVIKWDQQSFLAQKFVKVQRYVIENVFSG